MKLRKLISVLCIITLLAAGCATQTPNTQELPPSTAPSDSSPVVSNEEKPQKLDTIKMALAAFQDVNSVMVGVEKGFFVEEGIDLQVVRSDWGGGNELLIGGKVDVACSGDTEMITQNAVGVDTTLAFPYFYFAGSAFMYDAKKFPDWKTYSDLQQELGDDKEAIKQCIKQIVDSGAKIGLSSGGELPTFLQLIGYAGYKQSDLTVYDMIQEDLPPALFSGSIDIMISGIPQRLAALKEGYVSLLAVTDFPELISHNGFAARRSWVDNNFDLALRFQRALFKTLDYVQNNPDESFAIIADSLKEAGTIIDPENLRGVWNKMEFFPNSIETYEKWTMNEDGQFYWRSRFLNCVKSLEDEDKIPKGVVTEDNIENLLYGLKIVKALQE